VGFVTGREAVKWTALYPQLLKKRQQTAAGSGGGFKYHLYPEIEKAFSKQIAKSRRGRGKGASLTKKKRHFTRPSLGLNGQEGSVIKEASKEIKIEYSNPPSLED